MKKSKIILLVGIAILVAGIILGLVIETLAGSYVELQELWLRIIGIVLVASGLITIGVVIMYEFSIRKFKRGSSKK